MKAIVTIRNQDGSYDEVGMRNRFVTNAYKTQAGLLRGIRRITSKAIRVEVYHNNEINSQPKPDQTFMLEASHK